ncbi:MAG TPA: hypothetical protein VGB83_09105 [Actinomycetota bacterium]
MLDRIEKVLAMSTPGLRERYLDRIKNVPGPEARALERRLVQLVMQDRKSA